MERVSFLVVSTDERISCLLNPETVNLARATGVSSRRDGRLGQVLTRTRDDELIYSGGGSTTLELELLFDVTLPGNKPQTENVRELTQKLWRLTEPEEHATGKWRLPLVRFIWGKTWNVLGGVSALAERLDFFTVNGVPRRSWLRMRLQRVNEESAGGGDQPASSSSKTPGGKTEGRPAGKQGTSANSTGGASAKTGATPAVVVLPGTRLDQLAYEKYGHPAAWRQIAEANQIEHPLKVRGGTALALPLS